MNELKILDMVLPQLKQGSDIVTGPGDDCAVIDVGLEDKLLLIAADQVVSEIHYTLETNPRDIANKLLNRNISDIAAMGGTPAHAVLTIATCAKKMNWFSEFFEAIAQTAKKYNISLCGGDISSSPSETTVCSLTITGWVAKDNLCLRSNAKADDFLFATGSFGNSFASEEHLYFEPRLKEAKFIANGYSNAMIDTSDGLLLDAWRLCKSSKLGLTMFTDKIPCNPNATLQNALSDGEDYELLFAICAEKAEKLQESWKFKRGLTKIGIFTKDKINTIFDEKGKDLIKNNSKAGFKHFNE